jgi:hypothetical protein
LPKCHWPTCPYPFPEPYRRLTEKPDRVPQWCSKRWLKAVERKGGGKRRRAS